MRAQALANVLGLVVDCRIEPEFVDEVAAFRGAAGDADRAASLDFCDLPDGRANRAGSAGNDDGITLLRRADIQQAEISGHAGHAERVEKRRQRRELWIDLGELRAVEGGVFLNTEARRRHGRRRRNLGCLDAMTLPTAPARMTSPIPTGAMYDLPSFIQPRMAGSSDRYKTRASTSPSRGSGNGVSVNCQSLRFGKPTGRAASLIWWLMSPFMARRPC